MIDIKDIVIPEVEDVTGTASDPKSDWKEAFDLTALINAIIAFINKLIKFEF